MAIVKFEALNKHFTEVVARYMGYGLTIDSYAMSGTQGEIGKIALANYDSVYFIYMNRVSIGEIFNLDYHDGVKLIVERHDRDRRDMVDNWHTYWLGKGEILEEYVYHEVGRRGSDRKAYTMITEEWKQADEKTRSRYPRWDGGWHKVNFKMDTVIEIVKAKTGRKRVARENIVSVEKRSDENYWRINTMFNGKQGTVAVH